MKTPEITIQGVIYEAKPPKAKFWREAVAFDAARSGLSDLDFLEKHADILVTAFDDPAITRDTILDNLQIDDIMPLYFYSFKWLAFLINSKMVQIPNVESPAQPQS